MPLPNFPSIRRFVLAAALLVPVAMPALAQGTDEQREACAGDAFTLCRDTIPDIPKTTACMKAHEAQLSPRCHAVFVAATAPKGTAPAARKPKATTSKTAASKVAATKPARPKATVEARRPRREARTLEPTHRRVVAPPRQAAVPAPAVVAQPRQAAVPASAVVAPVGPAPIEGPSLPGLAAYRAGIAEDCREGLIDPFTCRSTLKVLDGGE